MAKDDITISGTEDPYSTGYYSPGVNSKNTLTIESFFKLLSAQLANQDMTSPMDNSEMMAQLTNMAMVQSITAMTTSIQNSTAVSTQTYAASMIGQEITVAIVDKDSGKPTGVKYGKVASVDFTQGNPVIKLEGDDTEYPMAYVLGVGHIEDPYKPKPDEDGDKEEGEGGGNGNGSSGTDPGKPESGGKKGIMGIL